MMRQADAAAVSLWTAENEAALRQCGQFAAYGADTGFLRFYEDDNGSRLSVFDRAATLVANGDIEEIGLYLAMDPSVRSVRTDSQTAKRIAQLWNVPYKSEAVMAAPERAENDDRVEILPLREAYDVLIDGFGADTIPPFDAWYADVHHRFRRGLCRCVGVRENGIPVACAMTVAECDGVALMGAVATKSEARGKGYASACVLTLASMLQAEGKRVLLSPKNEYAHRLYDRIGFMVVGEWGSVDKTE